MELNRRAAPERGNNAQVWWQVQTNKLGGEKMDKVKTLSEISQNEEFLSQGQIVLATPDEARIFNESSDYSGQWLERVYHGEFQEINDEKHNWYEVCELTEE